MLSKVSNAKLFVRRMDVNTYTLHRFHKGKIKKQYFAKVIITST